MTEMFLKCFCAIVTTSGKTLFLFNASDHSAVLCPALLTPMGKVLEVVQSHAAPCYDSYKVHPHMHRDTYFSTMPSELQSPVFSSPDSPPRALVLVSNPRDNGQDP
jgi:hypothetical protein